MIHTVGLEGKDPDRQEKELEAMLDELHEEMKPLMMRIEALQRLESKIVECLVNIRMGKPLIVRCVSNEEPSLNYEKKDEQNSYACTFCGKESEEIEIWSAKPRKWVCSDKCLTSLDEVVHRDGCPECDIDVPDFNLVTKHEKGFGKVY